MCEHIFKELNNNLNVEFADKKADFSFPWKRVSMFDLVSSHFEIEIKYNSEIKDILSKLSEKHDIHAEATSVGVLVYDLFENHIEDNILNPTFVTDYPKEVSPFARENKEAAGVTERFELFAFGSELANGFSELIDPADQEERLKEQAKKKKQGDEEAHVEDEDYIEALDNAYARNDTDEFVSATSIGKESIGENSICDGDVVVFMNFRPDRARQITHAFVDKEFHHFKRSQFLKLGSFVMTTDYGSELNCACAFPKIKIKDCLGEILEKNHKKQFRIAETEKYAHVTFFLNGGRETVFEGEDRALLASPKISTYDLKPEMSGNEVTERLIAAINSQQYDVIICNYANCDMVGHTGNYQAAIKSVEAVEKFVTKALKDKIPGGDFTVEQAIMVYNYNKAGVDIPGLSQADKNAIVKFIEGDAALKLYADQYGSIVNTAGGLATPDDIGWLSETLASNLNEATNRSRESLMQQFEDNWNTIFSEKNLNKIESEYGLDHRLALEDMFFRMKHGTNRRGCLLYTSPSPRDLSTSRMPSSA